jgi:DNA-binding transcriptional LysR family regulator
MPRQTISDLLAFRAVARERSFTRAAAQIGVSPSALSHTIRALEERLGTTPPDAHHPERRSNTGGRAVAGQRRPALRRHRGGALGAQRAARQACGHRPHHGRHPCRRDHPPARAHAVPAPLPRHTIQVELSAQAGFIDIVAERFDAGVQLGETVAQDMVAVRIGPDMRMAVVASPAYLSDRRPPRTPHDLDQHRCITLRFPTRGGLYAWEFERAGRALNVRVEGQLIVNEIALARQAALDGAGLAYLPEDDVRRDVEAGRLTRVLEPWCPPFPGYHLYYPSRRQQSPAVALLVGALRYRL